MRALFDTGATRTVMSTRTYVKLSKLNNLTRDKSQAFLIKTASGAILKTYGTTQVTLTLGDQDMKVECVICDRLKRDLILGLDMQKDYQLGTTWTPERDTWPSTNKDECYLL